MSSNSGAGKPAGLDPEGNELAKGEVGVTSNSRHLFPLDIPELALERAVDVVIPGGCGVSEDTDWKT